MGPMKDRSAGRRDLLAAGSVAVKSVCPNHADLAAAAMRADEAVRESQPEEKLAAISSELYFAARWMMLNLAL